MWCESVEGAIFSLSCSRPTGMPGCAGADQRAVDLEPGRIAQGFEMGGGVVEFHGAQRCTVPRAVNDISRIIEILVGRRAHEIRIDEVPIFHKSGYMETEEAILALAALAQSTRLDVFRLLVRHEPEGLAAGDIARLLASRRKRCRRIWRSCRARGSSPRERHSRSIVYRADLAEFRDVVLFMLRDCCDGRPEICAPVVETLHACCKPQTKGAEPCLINSICRAASRPKRSARASGRDRGRLRHHGREADQGCRAGAARQHVADRRDSGGADHHSRADLRRAFQSGRDARLCAASANSARATPLSTSSRRLPAALRNDGGAC